MLRLLLFELLAFLTPFLIYWLYVIAFKKTEDGEKIWQQAPLYNLGMAGLLLVGSGILVYGVFWA